MAAAGGESRIDGGFCEGYVTKDEKAGYKGKSKMNIQKIRKTMEAVFVTGQIYDHGFYMPENIDFCKHVIRCRFLGKYPGRLLLRQVPFSSIIYIIRQKLLINLSKKFLLIL